MNRKYFFAFRVFFFALTILFCAAFAEAQSIEPDEQILREMTAFARKTQNNLDLSRPRIIDVSNPVRKPAFSIPANVENPNAAALALEHLAFDWLNNQRIEQGLKTLKWNDEIAKIARYHSDSMARGNYFSHKEPDGSMVNNRADLFGMSDWQSIGENIAFNRGFKLPAESACQQWMNSTAHRENILDTRWKEAGIGVAVTPNGTYYFTEVFILK